jgi:hypothetical protein
MPESVNVRYRIINGVRYLHRDDVAALICTTAATEETDVRRRFELLAKSLTMSRAEKRAAKAQKLCDDWNADVVVGMPVSVRRDDGSILETCTYSKAWVICGHASVLVEGISGGYALDRVTLRQAPVSA